MQKSLFSYLLTRIGLLLAACGLVFHFLPIKDSKSFFCVVALLVLLGVAATLYISKRFAAALGELERTARGLSDDGEAQDLSISGTKEIATAIRALEDMARTLKDKMRVVEEQRNELNAVLSSMVEGVVVIDLEARIVSMNQAARNLLGVELEASQGLSVYEAIRNSSFHNLVASVIREHKPINGEVRVFQNEEKIMQGNANVILNSNDVHTGALIVLNDITKLRQLEKMRQDFVANVSHELKTPITSIKGFVETLLDGAIEDKEDASRFLQIISRHTDRLSMIIEDLLNLSRLEQSAAQGVALRQSALRSVIESVVTVCGVSARKKKISLSWECALDLHACINESLLEQALVNLIDNAINYSPVGSSVKIRAERLESKTDDSEVVISVSDEGRGISKRHISRIFERFYRVDEGRTRTEGGTGLGLAIVKHIVQVHGGYPTVESTPGMGSRFEIHLPEHLN